MSDGCEMLAKGLLERIGLNESILTHTNIILNIWIYYPYNPVWRC